LDLGSAKWPELMNEADARVELRKASDALLDAGHGDQDHAHVAAVEDGAHLFETVHLQSVGLIDDDEGRRVRDLLLASLVVLVRLKIDGSTAGRSHGEHPGLSRISRRLASSRSLIVSNTVWASRSIGRTAMPVNFSRALSRSEATLEGVLTTSAVYMTVSNMMEGIVASFHRS
jgi:hypothetical protein